MELNLHDLQHSHRQGPSAGRYASSARQPHFTANQTFAAAPAQPGSRPHSLLFTRFTRAAAAAPTQPESRPPAEQTLSL
jgi:hypothetical protein